MTVKEYNTIVYPKISQATVFVHGIEHAIQKTSDPDEVQKQLMCIGWSKDCKEVILEALEYYNFCCRKAATGQDDGVQSSQQKMQLDQLKKEENI